jgi:DNA polymerase-1
MQTLLLVDGTAFLYRAFHALPDLRTSRGEPTGAVRGFVSMLRNLREMVPADYCVCVFDAKGPTFRDDLYPQYKAQRPPMPADLVAQIDAVRQLSGLLGWPVLEVPRVEADDVLGTLALRARRDGMAVVIASGDKDLMQLVGDGVELIDTMTRDGAPPRRIGREQVIEKFGVPPERIIDFLTLVGDTADNIPGVDKVGPKTAAKWLQQYGSLDALVDAADTVGGAVGQHLRAALPWLPTARQLVTIDTAVDLQAWVTAWADLSPRAPDTAALRDWFDRLEFRSWSRDPAAALPRAMPSRATGQTFDDAQPGAEAGISPAPSEPKPLRAECILSPEQLDAWIERLRTAPLVSIDTETDSLDAMSARLVGISLSVQEGEGCYIPLGHAYAGAPEQLPMAQVLALMRPWLEDESCPKLAQHAKYDTHVFANQGIALAGVAHDTLLQSYVLESHLSHDLGSLATRHLGRATIAYEDVCGKGAKQIGFDQLPLESATTYAAEDAEVTLAVHQRLWPSICAQASADFVYRQIEMRVTPALFGMERHGVLIDPEKLRRQSAELSQRLVVIESEAYALAGQPFNLASPRQVGDVLFTKLGLPIKKKTASGAPSTDEEVLEKLAEDFPLPRLLLEHRGLAKLRSTYCDKLPAMIRPDTGRVHTSYGQAVAVTGRLASSDPNLQNIPVRTAEGRRIREAFIAPPGCVLMSADYSQIELRIMAHISADAGLIAAFEQAQDVHRATAAEMFGVGVDDVSPDQRRAAKAINFGLMYGMSAFGLAAALDIGRDAAKQYIDRYFERYPGVARYMEQTRVSAAQQGYVETVFGRRLWLPDIRGANGPRRQAAERAAINAPMQGTAADLIKLAMIEAHGGLRHEGFKTRLIMQVHDELVFEVPRDEIDAVRERVRSWMCGVAQWQVPLEVDIGVGANWEEAH